MMISPRSSDHATAVFNADRTHRYALTRTWSDGPTAVFVGCNPSYADEVRLDNTTRKCRAWAEAWGYGRFVMLNVLSRVSTDPHGLRVCTEVTDPENAVHLGVWAHRAHLLVCCWGAFPLLEGHRDRAAGLLAKIGPLYAMRITAGGHPGHPLYLPNATRPFVWRQKEGAA